MIMFVGSLSVWVLVMLGLMGFLFFKVYKLHRLKIELFLMVYRGIISKFLKARRCLYMLGI